MPKSSEDIESRFYKACEIAKQQEKPNISALAREFGVSSHRLRGRLAGRSPRNGRPTLWEAVQSS